MGVWLCIVILVYFVDLFFPYTSRWTELWSATKGTWNLQKCQNIPENNLSSHWTYKETKKIMIGPTFLMSSRLDGFWHQFKQCVVPENIQTPTMEGISVRPPTSLDFPFLKETDDLPPTPPEFPQVWQRPPTPLEKLIFTKKDY